MQIVRILRKSKRLFVSFTFKMTIFLNLLLMKVDFTHVPRVVKLIQSSESHFENLPCGA